VIAPPTHGGYAAESGEGSGPIRHVVGILAVEQARPVRDASRPRGSPHCCPSCSSQSKARHPSDWHQEAVYLSSRDGKYGEADEFGVNGCVASDHNCRASKMQPKRVAIRDDPDDSEESRNERDLAQLQLSKPTHQWIYNIRP
jgi:hypothetical protein